MAARPSVAGPAEHTTAVISLGPLLSIPAFSAEMPSRTRVVEFVFLHHRHDAEEVRRIGLFDHKPGVLRVGHDDSVRLAQHAARVGTEPNVRSRMAVVGVLDLDIEAGPRERKFVRRMRSFPFHDEVPGPASRIRDFHFERLDGSRTDQVLRGQLADDIEPGHHFRCRPLGNRGIVVEREGFALAIFAAIGDIYLIDLAGLEAVFRYQSVLVQVARMEAGQRLVESIARNGVIVVGRLERTSMHIVRFSVQLVLLARNQ